MSNPWAVISLVAVFGGVFSSASASTDIECGGIGYRYIDNFFAEDEVKWLFPDDVEWRDFCSASRNPDEALISDFPLAVCETTSEYQFKVSPLHFSDGEIGLQLLWRKGDVSQWKQYLFTLGKTSGQAIDVEAKKTIPFDVLAIFNHFKEVHTGELNWSWITFSKSYSRINFEIKRMQYEALSVSTSGGETFKVDGNKGTFDCGE